MHFLGDIMRRNHAVMFLVLVIVALTGFVLDTPQATTRWEYGQLRTLLYFANGEPENEAHLTWVTTDRRTRQVRGTEIFAELGCEQTGIHTVFLLDCFGGQGWELTAVLRTFDERSGEIISQETFSYFKRPAQ